MNTVGKPGKLGEHVRCVVSVSMLTEGWDANTVTHVLGVRAFGTQLLCEQVVGRGLRRRSLRRRRRRPVRARSTPRSTACRSASSRPPARRPDPKPGPIPPGCGRIDDRIACEITFPRLVGYRWEIPDEHLEADFIDESRLALDSARRPDPHRRRRRRRRDRGAPPRPLRGHARPAGRVPARQAPARPLLPRTPTRTASPAPSGPGCSRSSSRSPSAGSPSASTLKDDAFVGLLAMAAARRRGRREALPVDRPPPGRRAPARPVLRPYDPVGSTRYVDFDTTKDVYVDQPDRCHVSHVVCDSGWEAHLAGKLEHLADVRSYVKNQGLGLHHPVHDRRPAARLRPRLHRPHRRRPRRRRPAQPLIEVSGAGRRDKEHKVSTARDLWIPAVNNHGGFGRWRFIEVTDPWEAAGMIEAVVERRRRSVADEPDPQEGRPGRRRSSRPATPTRGSTSRPASWPTSSPTTRRHPGPLLYPRDPSLDPQLVWKGKDEQDLAEYLSVADRADLHPGEDRPAGARREPAPDRRAGERRARADACSTTSTASSSTSSSTSTPTRATGRTGSSSATRCW